MRYCTYDQWRQRTHSTTPPKRADGEIDQARVEALLDDAAARCMGAVPGALICPDGRQLTVGQLFAPLADAVVYWSAALVDCWLTPPGKESKRIEKTLLEEMALALHGVVAQVAYADDFMSACPDADDEIAPEVPLGPSDSTDPTETPLTPSTPVVTPHTNYLLASLDQTFSAAEVIASGTNSALTIPAGTVHSGGELYFAYARAATAGVYRYVYLYPQGHRDPQSQIAGWIDDGTVLDISGVSQRLLRTRVAYHENANGSVVEAA